jgi:predicted short-subunit dehydrogenase-like oxidoreductase (DUF2520 family)
MSSSSVKPPVAVVGAGALGSALARGLAEAGYPVVAVISRTLDRARRLAERVDAPVAATAPSALPASARLIFLCVPDGAVAPVAEALYPSAHNWGVSTVAHTSGALTAAALEPLALRGATTLSFHPMQTFTPESGPSRFEGIYVGLEGEPAAVAAGEAVAAALGARTIVIPAAAKARYHLAAVLASNGLVTLMALVAEVLGSIGLGQPEAADLVRPLVEGTWRNLKAGLPEDVLTGPVVRGDLATLQDHLAALEGHLPHLKPVYAALATETIRVAVRSGQLSPGTAEELLDALHAALDAQNDGF